MYEALSLNMSSAFIFIVENIKGFKAGLEIHQQLDTQRLFSRTPTIQRDDAPNIRVKRFLRASSGEHGAVDAAALHEQTKQKYYLYQGYTDSDSLIELDEEPIADIEENALRIALSAAKLLHAFIPERIIVMRKIVVDGSNTSGFQRTALIGMDGMLEVEGKSISILTLCLEEDAAKLIQRTPTHDTYNLSRLGTPLLEVATGADITNPEQLKTVAQHIGLLLRNLSLDGKPLVKRGIGSIRQDVNISIAGGTRVEIKGAQDLRLIPKLGKLEAQRQHALLLLKKESIAKCIGLDKPEDITSCVARSSSSLLKKALTNNDKVIGLRIKNGCGLLGKELVPNRRFGTELADYAKVSAGLSGIIHSDELPAYGITADEKKAIAKALHCTNADGFLFVVGDISRTSVAMQSIIFRIQHLLKGVVPEVRQALPDGTTAYMRPLSGSSRLYPETDALPIIPPAIIDENAILPAEEYEKFGVDRTLITSLLRQQKIMFFRKLVEKTKNVKPSFIAELLITYEKELGEKLAMHITEQHLEQAFVALDKKKIAKQSLIPLLTATAKTNVFSINNFTLLSEEAIKKELTRIVRKHKNLPVNALIGRAMAELNGKAEPQQVIALLKKMKE